MFTLPSLVALTFLMISAGAGQHGGETVNIPGAKPQPKPSRPSGPARRPATSTPRPAAQLVGTLPASEGRVAVLVGVDGPSDGASGATDDARAVADVLVRNAGFPKGQVALATGDRATRDGLLQALGAQPAPPDGLLLFYFAGPSAEVEGVVYLLPKGVSVDAGPEAIKQNGVSADVLSERLVATGARQIVVVLDTCLNDPSLEGPARFVVTPAYARQFSLARKNLMAHALFLPASTGQGAYMTSERGRGYFTAGLVEALKGGAATRAGDVTLRRLVVFTREWVTQRLRDDYERQQTPDIDAAGFRENDVVVSRGYAPLGLSTISALNTEPEDPDAVAGEEAMGRSDFAAAADAFARLAARSPENPYVHARWSLALQGLKNYAEAARAMERAVELDPTKSDWLSKLGQFYFTQLNDPERAVGAFERALAVDPSPRMRSDLGIVLFEIGNRFYNQGKFEEAAAALARSRELNARTAPTVAPVLARAYSRVGSAHVAAGRFVEAIEVFGKAAEADPTNVDAQVGLATAHLKTGDVAAARLVVERLATINPASAANLQKQIDAAAPPTP
jgi:Flp pilus assembly protein TadD